MQEEEAERKVEEAFDPDALEKKRMQEAEEWRAEQLRSGSAIVENANL